MPAPLSGSAGGPWPESRGQRWDVFAAPSVAVFESSIACEFVVGKEALHSVLRLALGESNALVASGKSLGKGEG